MRASSSPAGFAVGRPLSVAEWEALPEDEGGELIDGRLVGEEMPDLVHEVVVAWLVAVLRAWLRSRGGLVVGSELKLVVGPGRGRKADVVAFFPGHPELPGRGAIRTPPDLLVEVLSEGRGEAQRDRVDKARDYAAFGVRWYWLVDPRARTVEILELGPDGSYHSALLLSGASATPRIDTVPGCAELSLDLAALWGEVEEVVPSEKRGPASST